MADAAKVQGVTVANLAKMWGTTVANIAKVMGLTVSSISGTVTAGTEYTFSNVGTVYTAVCMMDSTHAIVAYGDNNNSGYGTAVCLTLSGTTVSGGSPVVFESAGTAYTCVCKMDSTHAIVAYKDSGNSNYGTACCLSLSGTTITAGSAVVFESAATDYVDICGMDTSNAIVAYRSTANTGKACCLSLSGTTITAGTAYTFENANSTYIGICSVDTTHAVTVYRDEGNGSYGTCCYLTLATTTITGETPVVFNSAASSYMNCCSLDSTHVIVAYRGVGSQFYATARCLSISGSTITANAAVTLASSSSEEVDVTAMDSTHAIAVWRDSGGSNYGKACCITLAGTTCTAGTSATWNAATSTYCSVAMMDSTHAIAVCLDGGGGNHGTACCLTLS